MGLILHLLVFVAYAACAGAVALALPQVVATIDPLSAKLIGATVLLGGATVHSLFARLQRESVFADEIYDLRLEQSEVVIEVRRAREEAARVLEVIRSTGRGGSNRHDLDKVAAEVRVLQGLVDRLSDHGGASLEMPKLRLISGGGVAPDYADEPRLPTPKPVRPVPGAGLADDKVLEILREGLRSDRVDLYVQPVVSLPQRKRRYFECYSRIRAEDGMTIVPERYMGLAEQDGLIAAIDNMLLFRCVQLVRKTQKHKYDVSFFYNFSPHTLADDTFFPDFIDFMVQDSGLAPHLVFEFRQSDMERIDGHIWSELKRLDDIGFRFSVDQVTDLDIDFEQLARCHVKFLKIDADLLISKLTEGGGDIDILELKAALDRGGIDLIATNVETEDQVVELLDLKIDYAQGFLFGEPKLSRGA